MPVRLVTCSENTRSSFQIMLNAHIYPVLGDLKLSEITPAQITVLLPDFQKGHAHASKIKLHTILNSLFKMAYLSDTIMVNPMGKVQHPKARKDKTLKTKVEIFTIDELR